MPLTGIQTPTQPVIVITPLQPSGAAVEVPNFQSWRSDHETDPDVITLVWNGPINLFVSPFLGVRVANPKRVQSGLRRVTADPGWTLVQVSLSQKTANEELTAVSWQGVLRSAGVSNDPRSVQKSLELVRADVVDTRTF